MKNRSIELRVGAASSAESGTSARRRRQAGVTLIEVMTVVGVVGALAMVAVPRMGEMLSDRQARIVAMVLHSKVQASACNSYSCVFLQGSQI